LLASSRKEITAVQRTVANLAVILLLSLSVSAQEQPANQVDKVQRAQAILQQVRAALGGEANLKAIQSLAASGDYRSTIGQRQTSGEIKFELLLPDKYLKTLIVSTQMGALKTLEAVNGDDAWVDRKMINSPSAGGFGGEGGGFGGGMGGGGGMGDVSGTGGGGGTGRGGGMSGGGRSGGRGGGMSGPSIGGGMGRMSEPTPEMEALMQARARGEYARLSAAWLLTAPASIPLEFSYEQEILGKDGKADAVRITGADNLLMWLIVDQASHRPLMLTYREARQQRRPTTDAQEAEREPQMVEIQLYLSDYKQVNNVWLPHLIVKASNGQKIEEWKLKYKLNPGLKAKLFEKPQKKS
jgi:hypothetical protein